MTLVILTLISYIPIVICTLVLVDHITLGIFTVVLTHFCSYSFLLDRIAYSTFWTDPIVAKLKQVVQESWMNIKCELEFLRWLINFTAPYYGILEATTIHSDIVLTEARYILLHYYNTCRVTCDTLYISLQVSILSVHWLGNMYTSSYTYMSLPYMCIVLTRSRIRRLFADRRH